MQIVVRSAAESAFLVALSALFWGISGGIGAVLVAEGWSPLIVALYRGAVGLLFVSAWLLIDRRDHGLRNPALWFWSALAGLGIAGNFTFYFLSVAESSVAIAATLMYCAPVFVYLVSFAIGLESFSWPKLCAMAVILFGVVLITGVHDVDSGRVTGYGLAAGLLAGVSYAVFIFGFKFAAPHGSAQSILVIAFSALVIVLLSLSEWGQVQAVPTSSSRLLFIVLGVLGAGVSFVMYVVGLRNAAPAVAAVVAMIEPVTATLFAAAALGERLTGTEIFGMAVVLVTVTSLSVASGQRSHATSKHFGRRRH